MLLKVDYFAADEGKSFICRVFIEADTMAYFRIQEKCLTCSKRASYLGKTSWFDSPKLIKVLVAISLSRLFSLHIIPSRYITLFAVSYFLLEILRIPDNGRNRNLTIFYSFYFQETQRYTTTELWNPGKNFVKGSSPWLGSEENFVFQNL